LGDTCLWDTRTEIVSTALAAGATSAKATVTAGGQGFDCLNHEAQAFAVGPAAAWAFGGYTAGGIGMRNRNKATLTIAGIPVGATIVKALLYWNILNSSVPSSSMVLNATATPGTMIGKDPDPCWGATASWAFRADVTSVVAPIGNGPYTVSGYPTGGAATPPGDQTGLNPWDFGSLTPMAEGASLLVFYAFLCDLQQEDKGKGQVKDEHGQNGGDFDFDECDVNHEVGHKDKSHDVDFHSTKRDAPKFDPDGHKAVSTGEGLNNGRPVRYTLVVTDLGIGPGTDIYSLTLSDSKGIVYTRTGKLLSGNIVVRR
jgi:hypothetical protein